MEKIKGLVSVIIPNHNRDISGLLDSLKRSPYQKFEVIEVNLGLERSAQRNIGIDRAKGEFLLFLDSDQEITVDFDLLDNCVWLCSETRMYPFPPYHAVYIPEIIKAKGIFAAIRRWERKFYNGTAVDVVRFVRADHCPRFDETLSGPEDSDWDRRVLGRKGMAYFPLYHNDQVSVFTYFKKKAYYAESMARFAKKWPKDKVLDWRWRCIGVFFENGKWVRVLLRPDLFICVMFMILIRGIIYYAKR